MCVNQSKQKSITFFLLSSHEAGYKEIFKLNFAVVFFLLFRTSVVWSWLPGPTLVPGVQIVFIFSNNFVLSNIGKKYVCPPKLAFKNYY